MTFPKFNWMYALICASAFVLGMFVFAVGKVWAPHFATGASDLGTAGDSLGPFAALFSALALFAAFISLGLQTRELTATREEMIAQREEMTEQRKEMGLQRNVLNHQANSAQAQAVAARVQVVSTEAEFIAKFAAKYWDLISSVPPTGGEPKGICRQFLTKSPPRPPLFCTDDSLFSKAREIEQFLIDARQGASGENITELRRCITEVAHAVTQYEDLARNWCSARILTAHSSDDGVATLMAD